jgi:glycosyltransferase involved in cell wall biosynthesis
VSEPLSFSVVIDNRNYGRYLEQTLESALGQDYPAERMEVIAVDDGSTDDSRQVLARHAGHPRLKVVLQEHAGQAAAFVSGVAQASGDYVCLLDADDSFRRDKLKVLAERIAALQVPRGELFLCHDFEIYDEAAGKPLPKSWFEQANLAQRSMTELAEAKQVFPFSMPLGQVYSRELLALILEGLPAADWRTGADNPIAQAALLRLGRVHYVQEKLAQYRMHGENRLFVLDEKRNVVKRPQTQAILLARRPKLLWYLERYVDTLALSDDERKPRIDYLKHLSRTLPVSSAFAAAPKARVSFVVAGEASEKALAATLEAIERQTHANCEVLVAEAATGAPGTNAPQQERAMLEAFARASGQFVALIQSGDRPDRDFAERHLYMHHYLPSSMVSACDYRLAADGVPAQEGGYGRRKLWPARRRVPAMRRVPEKLWWTFSPRSGNVVRRSALVQAFIEHALRHPAEGVPAEWLLLHFAAALGGCIQFTEVLTTLEYDSPHPGALHAREPADERFLPRLAQPQAAAFYLRLMSARYEDFRAHFGVHAHRFARWALAIDAPSRLAPDHALPAAELHPELAAALRD